ncbi:MAG: sensor histidine kinase [Bacteroidia bacterium]
MDNILILYTFLGFVLLFLIAWLLLMIYKKRKTIIQLKKLRINIASDLHDEIGAALSSVSFYSEAAIINLKNNKPEQSIEILEKIGTTSRKTIESMSDIVWMINPNNDTLIKLFERIENFSRELLGSKDAVFRLNYDKKLNDLILNIDLRKNLYLICREAIHNAAKYSNANKVELTIKTKKANIEVEVKDNGIGFDLLNLKPGNGILNMKVRAKQIGASININSKIGNGTVIKFVFPYPHKW